MTLDGSIKRTGIVFSYAAEYDSHRESSPEMVGIHVHRGVELVYVAEGGMTNLFPGLGEPPCSAGTVVVIPPGVAHGQRNHASGCRTIYTVMEFDGGGTPQKPRLIDTAGDRLLANWFAELCQLNREYLPDQAALLLELIWMRLGAIESYDRLRMRRHPALVRATEWIEENYHRNIAVADIAAAAGVSRSYLNALFHRETGDGTEAFLAAVRMRRARQLLLDPCYNVSEVAERCGFASSNYFTRKFRLFHGVTPGEYRREPSRTADRINYQLPLRKK